MQKPKPAPKWVRNYDNVDLAKLRAEATELPCDMADEAEVEERWMILKEALVILESEFAPLKCRDHKVKSSCWGVRITKCITR